MTPTLKWISDAEFQAELKAVGCGASSRQLERWRNEGLLRPRPRQVANYRGSKVEHPATSARQALAIERALAFKNRRSYAGKLLWAAGFEVDEGYWRPDLLKADRTMRVVAKRVRQVLRRDADEVSLGERVAGLDQFTGVLANIYRRLPIEQFARVGNVAVEVIAGDFERFEEPASYEDEFTTQYATENAFGFADGDRDEFLGARFKWTGTLERVLSEMSAANSEFGPDEFTDFEIQAARDDIRNAMKIAVCLQEALSWIYGPKALGLQVAALFGRRAPISGIFLSTLGFARLRRCSSQLLPSAQIGELADQAEWIWLISAYFRNLQNTKPEMREMIGPKRLKRAFMDSREYGDLLKDLEGCDFPAPDFRPWHQWKELSRKTMSPGLLAMSIGAPLSLSAEAIAEHVSEHTNR